MIIIPSESSWLSFWKFIVHIALFYGYVKDPYFIAFAKSKSYEGQSVDIFFLITDIIMTINILICCFTSY